jgi:hypothetical protein
VNGLAAAVASTSAALLKSEAGNQVNRKYAKYTKRISEILCSRISRGSRLMIFWSGDSG